MEEWRRGSVAGYFCDRLRSREPHFIPESINRQTAVLARVDTVLVDSSTRPMFGPLNTGRVVEIDDSKVTIGGQYALGTGFMGLGVALASTANFARLFPQRGLNIVNLGAIRLKAGVDPDRAAGDLQKLTGTGREIFTRKSSRHTKPHIGRPAPRSESSSDRGC